MRILYVVSRYPTLSTTFVIQEIALLHNLGHTIEVCAFRPPSRADTVALKKGTAWIAPTRFAPKTLKTLVDTLRVRLPGDEGRQTTARERITERLAWGGLGGWIGATARAFQAHYIHAHFANAATTAAWAGAKTSGIPFGFTAHAHDIFQKSNPLLGAKTRAAALPVTISDHHRRVLIDRLGPETGAKFEVVRCGVDLEAFAPRHVPATHDICAVGRLIGKKGFDVLIRAIARLPSPRPKCHIVGEGPERATLEREIACAGVGDTVHLLGALPHAQVCEQIAQAKLFILPCRIAADGDRDGLPVVLMEALALGKAAISTPVAGIPELIEHEQTGLLTAIDSPDELAGAIGRLLADPDQASRLGQAGRARVTAMHDLRRNVAELASLVEARVRLAA